MVILRSFYNLRAVNLGAFNRASNGWLRCDDFVMALNFASTPDSNGSIRWHEFVWNPLFASTRDSKGGLAGFAAMLMLQFVCSPWGALVTTRRPQGLLYAAIPLQFIGRKVDAAALSQLVGRNGCAGLSFF